MEGLPALAPRPFGQASAHYLALGAKRRTQSNSFRGWHCQSGSVTGAAILFFRSFVLSSARSRTTIQTRKMYLTGVSEEKPEGAASNVGNGTPANAYSMEATRQDALGMMRRISRATFRRTISNVGLWTLSSTAIAYLFFPQLQKVAWRFLVGTPGPSILNDTSIGYLGNFLALMSLLFSILAGNSYTSLYSQNEAIVCALFAEVSEAKALMEQLALVCSGRPFYRSALENIGRYVKDDLRRLDEPPAVLVACKPRDDPLESILYLTSVGVPSALYETVRSLRQLRGARLGALQRKLPPVQIGLLYVLGSLNLVTFLLLATRGDGRLIRSLFALLAGALMMTMRVIHELWTPIGGAYNVDAVLAIMVGGMEDELKQRLQGRTFSDTRLPPPPPRWSSGAATRTR